MAPKTSHDKITLLSINNLLLRHTLASLVKYIYYVHTVAYLGGGALGGGTKRQWRERKEGESEEKS